MFSGGRERLHWEKWVKNIPEALLRPCQASISELFYKFCCFFIGRLKSILSSSSYYVEVKSNLKNISK